MENYLQVSILVFVELALGLLMKTYSGGLFSVSILVFVELALGQYKYPK